MIDNTNDEDRNESEHQHPTDVLSAYDRIKSFYAKLLYEKVFIDTLLFEHETNLFEKNKNLIKSDIGFSLSILACI